MHQKSGDSFEKHPYEFMVSVELLTPTNAGSRKTTISGRKPRGASLGHPEEVVKKFKGGSSWIPPLVRLPADTGRWRSATCKVLDEDGNCSLFIYIDDAILYHTVLIHNLSQTDIRLADSSMFHRKNCIRIASADSQPIYLHFSDSDTCNTWLVLLRSYAKPELYGPPPVPHDGGLYRMWRQVDLLIIQGRYLGNTKILLDPSTSSTPDEVRTEADPVDLDVFCEIQLNDRVCGRTSVRKGIGSPEWHEHFLLADLPPFEALEVLVWKEKRLTKPVLLGSIRIALTNFRRGEDVEGWFPVTQSCGPSGSVQVGEVRMRLRVDEEIILPHRSYETLLTILHTRNILEWMDDFERKLQLRTLSEHLVYIAVARNELIKHIMEYANLEVDGTPSSHNTLFRGNTVFTKAMELAMLFYGRTFLENSIGKTVHRLCSAKIALEVDPVRSGKNQKDTEREVEELIKWCQEIWDSIYANRKNCPHEIRRLFEHIRKLVENRYKDGQGRQKQELPWQSVSAFCFLRFIVPAILHPYQFGLYPSLPGPSVQRSLTLVAKVIQSLANLNATVQKEESMRGVKDFLQQNLQAMVDYILVVSTPFPEASHSPVGPPGHQRLQVVNSLRQRGAGMTVLGRESVPLLPHLLDVPRHLACISSSLVRSSRMANPKWKFEGQGDHLSDLCSRCLEVEEMGLQRVTQMARHTSPLATFDTDSLTTPVSRPPPSPSPTPQPEQFQGPSSGLSSVATAGKFNLSTDTPSSSSSIARGSFLRRGSLSDTTSQSTHLGEERSRRSSHTRFIRSKSVSADAASPFVSHSGGSLHLSSSTRSLGTQDRPTSGLEKPGKKGKHILTGLLPRR